MKTIHHSLALVFTAIFAGSAMNAYAVPTTPTFSFHETGAGELELPNGAVIPLPGTLTADSGPGGLTNVLTFTIHPQEDAAFTVGDVLLLDNSGGISDLLRFAPAVSSGTGLTQFIFLYSNDGAGLLADTGPPTAFYPNSVNFPEVENGATIFTPTAGQPGFLPVAPLPITYQVFSTPDTGSTILLLGLGVSGLALMRGDAN